MALGGVSGRGAGSVVVVRSFEELQAGLGPVLGLHRDGGRSEHVVVVLPSLSLDPSVEAYYDTLAAAFGAPVPAGADDAAPAAGL